MCPKVSHSQNCFFLSGQQRVSAHPLSGSDGSGWGTVFVCPPGWWIIIHLHYLINLCTEYGMESAVRGRNENTRLQLFGIWFQWKLCFKQPHPNSTAILLSSPKEMYLSFFTFDAECSNPTNILCRKNSAVRSLLILRCLLNKINKIVLLTAGADIFPLTFSKMGWFLYWPHLWDPRSADLDKEYGWISTQLGKILESPICLYFPEEPNQLQHTALEWRLFWSSEEVGCQ